jgi:hypothetical protein
LLILTHIRSGTSDPSVVPFADSLVTRYPNDPEGLVRGAEAFSDLARAIPLLNRAIALDSAAGAEQSAYCRLCEAFHTLVLRYQSADSLEVAEQTARRWMSLRPNDNTPWALVAEVRLAGGRRAEAEAAQARAIALGMTPPDEGLRRLVWSLRTDDIESANDECRTGLPRAAGDLLGDFRWLCTVSLRMQGRFREAFRLMKSDAHNDAEEAVLAMNLGYPRMLRNSSCAWPGGQEASNCSFRGHWRATSPGTWPSLPPPSPRRGHAECATTGRFGRVHGAQEQLHPRSTAASLPSGDSSLRRRGDWTPAAVEFRAALTSPSLGYTRVNYELGKSLIALHRPAEAIPVVRAPLHGGLDGPGLYLTRTETHELLAQAFDGAGQRDSATAHYAVVERAWRHADTNLQSRYEAARARLVALTTKPQKR